MAFENVDKRLVEALALSQNTAHELGGIITLKPCGLIGFDAIRRAVSFAKCISVEAADQIPNFTDFCPPRGRSRELSPRTPLQSPAQRASSASQGRGQHVRPSGAEARKRLTARPERVPQARFKRPMRILRGLHLLVASRKGARLVLVGGRMTLTISSTGSRIV
jgi:hypothetical protein